MRYILNEDLFQEAVDAESISDNLIDYVGGGYSSVKSAVSAEEFKYIKDHMERTPDTFYRIEEAEFTADSLQLGKTFSFKDDIRSFSSNKNIVNKSIDEIGFDEPAVFVTQGTVSMFDMAPYTVYYNKYGQDQFEVLIGGSFKVVSIEDTNFGSDVVKQITIKQVGR